MSFKLWVVILLLCIAALMASEAKAASEQETYYEIGYDDGHDNKPPNTVLGRNASYRDGYAVGHERRNDD